MTDTDVYDDSEVDWEYKCVKCGAHVTDPLSQVCYECRQKMVLVDTKEYEALKAEVKQQAAMLESYHDLVDAASAHVNKLKAEIDLSKSMYAQALTVFTEERDIQLARIETLTAQSRASVPLRILFVLEDDTWVGTTIDHGVVAQGKTLQAAHESLMYTFASQFALHLTEGQDPFAEMKPAPDELIKLFEAAKPLTTCREGEHYAVYYKKQED